MDRQSTPQPAFSSVVRHLLAWAQHATGRTEDSAPGDVTARMTVHRVGDAERSSRVDGRS